MHFQKLKLKMFLIENWRNWSFSQLMNTIHPWYGFRRSCCFFQNIFESFPKLYVLVSLYMFGLVHIYVFFACCCIKFLARWCVSSQKILKNENNTNKKSPITKAVEWRTKIATSFLSPNWTGLLQVCLQLPNTDRLVANLSSSESKSW